MAMRRRESSGARAMGWTAAAAAALACGFAQASERGGAHRPHYEVAASGETRDGAAAARVELDAAIPLHSGESGRDALFLQPGLLLSHGPQGRTLYGGSLGAAYRFEGAGGIVGANAFFDLNGISQSGRSRAHAQASVGADYQAGRNRIGANYYFPLSGRIGWEEDRARFGEYAVGGPELRYRFTLGDGWSVNGRAFYEIDRGGLLPDGARAANGWRLAGGAGYRFGCTRVGLDFERDTRRGETAARLSLAFRFGAGTERCAGAGKPDLLALVEREKSVATRQVFLGFIPLTPLPADVTELYQIVMGAADAETVWLFSQGGPNPEFMDDLGFTKFLAHADRLRVNVHLVNVHQVQTLNPDLFEDPRLDSVGRVVAEMDVSVEILDRVIRHFKDQGKKVVVFSHSFGSFVLPRYLALKGPGAADRYVIMAGRLDIEKKMYENRLGKLHEGGTVGYHYPDGTTLTEIDLADDPTVMLENGMLPLSFRRQAAFQGALGKHRYTRLLAGTDLSKVIYAYGTADAAIGRLTDAEVAFLKARDAEVLAVTGGHASMFDDAQ